MSDDTYCDDRGRLKPSTARMHLPPPGRLRPLILLALFIGSATAVPFPQNRPAHRVSDNGDGTFTNPPLYADYPDPDVIRVGHDFYLVSTTFVNVPALTILHSKDLVNWEFAAHVLPRLEGREEYDLKNGGAYRGGVFAASLRYSEGTFYIVDTPVGENTRVYRSQNVDGPWQVHRLNRAAFDPGFFIDTDGTGYIFTSGGWDGHVSLMKLDADFAQVVDERQIFYYKGIEGSHAIKHGPWYYVFNAIPGKLAMACSRAKNIYGPYETTEVLNDANGGHQGAIVDLPDGNWYGFAMRDCGSVGRMTYFSPVFWRDDWPVWGTPDAPGKIPSVARKPIEGEPILTPAASDDFDSPTLGLQWQWNHNPEDARWSLTERPGCLRLKPTKATGFWTARNTLTQKGQGPWCRGEAKLDVSHLASGDICGLGTLGKVNGRISVTARDGNTFLGMEIYTDAPGGGKTEARVASVPVAGKELFLRTDMDFVRNKALCSYSLDGVVWTALGGDFDLEYDWQSGTFQGEQFAIFCYNPNPGAGFLDVESFHFEGRK